MHTVTKNEHAGHYCVIFAAADGEQNDMVLLRFPKLYQAIRMACVLNGGDYISGEHLEHMLAPSQELFK